MTPRSRQRGWRALRLGTLGLATALAAWLSGFAVYLARLPDLPAAPRPSGGGIVVLTGGAGRIAEGLRLLEADPDARLLVSGVHPGTLLAELERPPGLDMAALAARVTLGREALSTRGNAEEAAAWARAEGLSTLVVVTAGYHMPRALLLLRRVLPDVRLVPHPVTPPALREPRWWLRPALLRLAAAEYTKLLAAWAGYAPAEPGVGRRDGTPPVLRG